MQLTLPFLLNNWETLFNFALPRKPSFRIPRSNLWRSPIFFFARLSTGSDLNDKEAVACHVIRSKLRPATPRALEGVQVRRCVISSCCKRHHSSPNQFDPCGVQSLLCYFYRLAGYVSDLGVTKIDWYFRLPGDSVC